ncbi:MAG: PEP-CTERM sorting domain-containing protein [Okeania sp. SIO2C2]|uniref:PEP-CTERM sorting domain-containing protein n=1 Tax=Okeania sp. SIO2C2 TaxID=2607787 RepID=UPI0013BBA8D8|nr:PEP-CTERM sorting domain-containing protein [Okeania sp. SIO2C2]NEP89178.1 PEP-CTERM sorting domain-containing protein [Okeania sp. SIO2C2]
MKLSSLFLTATILLIPVQVFAQTSSDLLPDTTTTAPCDATCVESPKPMPEPTSILGFLTLGTLGTVSTLKRKLNSSKSIDKELEKVS